jgi:hypothetical protein
MDLSTPVGSKIRFNPHNNGYELERKKALETLEVNKLYTLAILDVGQSHSVVVIDEFPHLYFNSVLFENENESSL